MHMHGKALVTAVYLYDDIHLGRGRRSFVEDRNIDHSSKLPSMLRGSKGSERAVVCRCEPLWHLVWDTERY